MPKIKLHQFDINQPVTTCIIPVGPEPEGHSLRLAEVVAPAYHCRNPSSLALNVHFAPSHARINCSSSFTSSNVIPQTHLRVLSVPLNLQLRSMTLSSCSATSAVLSKGLSRIFSGFFFPFPFPFSVHGPTGRSIGSKFSTPWISERTNVLLV